MNADYQFSFWEQESFLKSYDLIVVGAGIVGMSTSLFYKHQNPEARIAILERGFLPKGASTRNAGFACVGSISEHMADMEKESEENIKERISRRYNGLELLKKTLGEDQIGYEHTGGYELFTSREKFEQSAGEIDRFNGWMSELIHEEEVYRMDELEGYPVIYNRLEGALHPGMMMNTLAQKVSESDIEIKWNSTVEHVTKEGHVTITDGPQLQAEKVLFAANGFISQLLPDIDIKPARGYVLVTNALDNLPWRGIFHHDRGYIYFRNVGNRLLIGGARNLDINQEETDQFGINEKIKSHLITFVSDVLKLPSGWKIEKEWSGIMGFSQTKTPIIQKLDKKRHIAAGLSGMGIAIGMEVAQSAANLLSTD